jgi:phage portal protein BeeE
MGLIERLSSAWSGLVRSNPVITADDYAQLVSFNGNVYLTGALNQTLRGQTEEIDGSFAGLVQSAYKANGVVFACMLARMQLFTEARFQFQQMRNGRPQDLFGDASLAILEHPWPNGVTGDLLARAIQDADLAGNFFAVRRRDAIRRLRPDWITIVLGSPNDPEVQGGDIDAEVLGYIYHPGGRGSGRQPEGLLREQVCHFAPIPDPVAAFRGMSWLTPVMREISADSEMTSHKRAYLLNGATPNLTVAIDKDLKEAANPQAFAEWVEAFKKANPTGTRWDKFKTWYLAGGTTVTKVGSNFQEIDFKAVQGAGETRIAAAAGVPPVIVGLSEGLQAATYSNYGQARRRFADNTMRPLWRNMAGSLETIVPPPPGSRLWYDDRDIQALAEDKKDLAEVRQLETQQMRSLVDGGFTADSVISAVTTGDWTRLSHTGLFSVQLQPPGNTTPDVTVTKPNVPQLTAGRSEPAEVRCSSCDRLLAERATPPYRIVCSRCKAVAEVAEMIA